MIPSELVSASMPRRVLITGAAGAIGSCLREGLRLLAEELVLTDVRDLEPTANERFVRADLSDREVICARIGTFAERPRRRRDLATWLSPADAVRLFAACLSAPAVDYRVVYGASANARCYWDLTPAREPGYEPRDDAERYANDV